MSAAPGTVGVVGAGLVGLAVARRLAQLGHVVTVFDKETGLARHQSGHNSGVVHSGIYYKPGSLKATLCRRGVGLLKDFCAEHDVEYREIGKVVVARDESEVGRLRDIQNRAERNGVPDVSWLDSAQLTELEPNVRGVAALHSARTAIVDYPAVARAMAGDIESSGGRLELGAAVTGISRDNAGGARVHLGDDVHEFAQVVLCGGLQADTLARLAGDDTAPAIIPFRGEYYRLVPERADLVNRLVYPVPDPAYPFLGVHITPRIDGSVDIGPNAVLAMAREGYTLRDINPRELAATLRFSGSRRLFRQHWRVGIEEMRGSMSKRRFVALAASYVPSLTMDDVVKAPAGVRAQAVDADGSLVDDFRVSRLGAVTAVRNAPSPAATSCLAIGEYIVDGLAGKAIIGDKIA